MKKQIIYPDFIARIFSTALDLSLFAFIAIPILQFCFFYLMVFFYNDYFQSYNIDLHNQSKVLQSVMSQEFYEYLKAGNFNKYILFNISILLINLTVIGSYFIGFWYYKGATIGKIFMRMRIVDANDFNRPTLKQLIKRFLGYMTFPIGIFFILFSSQKQALHDKIAGTVVIKA
ncbi:RDD family protein [Rickettsia endosymbiont of Gonocerus acuteangulatus]|uniref:RDD family protein n=1 Tax=Rickettsia endosymbiont of Gonocerus acuteangulatus TaxID=3066266 RepID=UPI0031330A4F